MDGAPITRAEGAMMGPALVGGRKAKARKRLVEEYRAMAANVAGRPGLVLAGPPWARRWTRIKGSRVAGAAGAVMGAGLLGGALKKISPTAGTIGAIAGAVGGNALMREVSRRGKLRKQRAQMIDRGEIDPRDKRSYSSNAAGVSPVGRPDMKPNLRLGKDKLGRKRWLRVDQPAAEPRPAGQASAVPPQPKPPAAPPEKSLGGKIVDGLKTAGSVAGKALDAYAENKRNIEAESKGGRIVMGKDGPEIRARGKVSPEVRYQHLVATIKYQLAANAAGGPAAAAGQAPTAGQPAAAAGQPPADVKAAIARRKSRGKPQSFGQKALNVAKGAGKVALAVGAGAALAAGTARLAGQAGKAIEGSTPTGRNRQYQRAAAASFRGKTIDAARGQASAPKGAGPAAAGQAGPAGQAPPVNPTEQARRELAQRMAEEYRRRLMERYAAPSKPAAPKGPATVTDRKGRTVQESFKSGQIDL